MKKTYEITYWVWNAEWEEYEPMYMGCGENSLGKEIALSLYNAATLTKDVPQVSITEYTYDDNDEYIDDVVIEVKEL